MNYTQLKYAVSGMKNGRLSMKRRLALYIAALLLLSLAFIGILLNFLGILNFTSGRIQNTLSRKLEETIYAIETDMDLNAAHAISFANQLSAETERYLGKNKTSFAELENNIALIDGLQIDLYNIIATNMNYANCSGAFFVLNTTVNSSLADKHRSGIYLKFSYISSQSMINHQASMLYGSSAVSREYGIDYYSSWHLEVPAGIYTELDSIFDSDALNTENSYYLTGTYKLPETWESVRFLCVPVFDSRQRLLGVCGFEISSLYFGLSHSSHDNELTNIVHGLFSKNADGKLVGQLSGNHSGYSPSDEGNLTIEHRSGTDVFSYRGETFIGKRQEMRLGGNDFEIVVMIPEYTYKNLLSQSHLRMAVIMLAILLLMLFVCLYFSNKYMKPILKGFEHIKTDFSRDIQTKIPEIDDLLDFLAERDDRHKQTQRELERLAYSRKKEIDPELYQMFLDNLSSLTPTEREVLNLYISGKKASEITKIMEIKENTLKYHNKNIYSKLGVASRKELLLYAALLKSEDTKAKQHKAHKA